jgi:hypothetical protein
MTMKKAEKVTRIIYSNDLNQAKYDALNEIAERCGSVRTEVWRSYGSVSGLGAKFRPVRDVWIADVWMKNLPQRNEVTSEARSFGEQHYLML